MMVVMAMGAAREKVEAAREKAVAAREKVEAAREKVGAARAEVVTTPYPADRHPSLRSTTHAALPKHNTGNPKQNCSCPTT
jgi:hypothetical protein